jgi:hypothetical protein
MTVTTYAALPPPIQQFFDPFLLDPLYGMLRRVQDIIIPLAKKKIRHQDVGKRKEFDLLKIKFMEAYERKKIEEEEYKTKIKNTQKRPSIYASEETCRFRRMGDSR